MLIMACVLRQSLLEVIHRVAFTRKVPRIVKKEKKKRAWERSLNPSSFLTSAQLGRHGMKLVWLGLLMMVWQRPSIFRRRKDIEGGGFCTFCAYSNHVLTVHWNTSFLTWFLSLSWLNMCVYTVKVTINKDSDHNSILHLTKILSSA